MNIQKFALATVVASFAVLASAATDAQQTAQQIQSAQACTQALADTKTAREQNPELGPKAAKAFDELLALAETRCTNKEFGHAAELLNVARGMVASE